MGMVGTINEAVEQWNGVMTHSGTNELFDFESNIFLTFAYLINIGNQLPKYCKNKIRRTGIT